MFQFIFFCCSLKKQYLLFISLYPFALLPKADKHETFFGLPRYFSECRAHVPFTLTHTCSLPKNYYFPIWNRTMLWELNRMFIFPTANVEELFKISKLNIYGSEQSSLGLELVGEMDGSPAVGEPKCSGSK